MLMPSVRATSCSVRRPSIHFSTTIARFSSLFVKVICSLSILTFSRNSYTLTISQHNNTGLKNLIAFPRGFCYNNERWSIDAMMREVADDTPGPFAIEGHAGWRSGSSRGVCPIFKLGDRRRDFYGKGQTKNPHPFEGI